MSSLSFMACKRTTLINFNLSLGLKSAYCRTFLQAYIYYDYFTYITIKYDFYLGKLDEVFLYITQAPFCNRGATTLLAQAVFKKNESDRLHADEAEREN
jgi:hypothetical protein